MLFKSCKIGSIVKKMKENLHSKNQGGTKGFEASFIKTKY